MYVHTKNELHKQKFLLISKCEKYIYMLILFDPLWKCDKLKLKLISDTKSLMLVLEQFFNVSKALTKCWLYLKQIWGVHVCNYWAHYKAKEAFRLSFPPHLTVSHNRLMQTVLLVPCLEFFFPFALQTDSLTMLNSLVCHNLSLYLSCGCTACWIFCGPGQLGC